MRNGPFRSAIYKFWVSKTYKVMSNGIVLSLIFVLNNMSSIQEKHLKSCVIEVLKLKAKIKIE